MKMTGPKKILFIYFLQCTLFLFVCSSDVEIRSYETGEFYDSQQAFSNLTIYLKFLDNIFNFLSNSENISDKCRNETVQLLEKANQEGDVNALKILDSTGKPSSGVLEGGTFFIGFYSECVNTVVNIKEQRLKGKYCLVNLNFSSPSQENIPEASWLVLTQKTPTIGICIPSSCSETDLENATYSSLNNIFEHVESHISVCHGNVSGFSKDAGAISVLCVLLVFIITAVAATVVDIVLSKRKNTSDSNADHLKTVSREALYKTEEPEPSKNIFLESLLAFSLKRNAVKIFTVKGTGEGIGCAHGIKFYSMSLIILGHTFSFGTQNLFFRNPGAAVQAPKDFLSQVFANGTLAVDTFYVISGILVSWGTLKVLDKTRGKFPLLYFYFHRYFRLTPLLVVVVLFCAFLLRYVGSGPNWLFTIEMYDEWCRDNGWLNALYLHNFVNTERMCLSHTWYLATDMQFYLLVPLILIPLHKNLKYGVISMSTFLLITVVTTAVITVINHYPAIPYMNNVLPMDLVNGYYKDVYIKPYCRMGPYIVGIAVGYFLYQNRELVLKMRTVILLWLSSVALGLTVIYLMWPANQGILPTDSEAAAYSALARTVWGISLAWLVIACHYGYGSIVNTILSWSFLVPLGRLTYCAYLIHPVVMNVYYGSTETTVDFSLIYMMYLFLGNLCITYIMSIALSLLFESPFVALEKVILSKKKS